MTRFRHSTLHGSRDLMVCAVSALALMSQSAGAQPEPSATQEQLPLSKHFRIDDADPEASLPSDEQRAKYPVEVGYLLMDLDARADLARKRGDHAAAVRYHRAGLDLMPDRAVSFFLVCEDYEQLGERRKALEACGSALALPGAKLDHFVRFVHLVTSTEGELDAAEVEDAERAIAHVKQQKGAELAGFELQCELSVRTKDVAALEECSEALLASAPDAPRALTFAWALAMEQQDYERARSLLAKAKEGGISDEAHSKMLLALDAARPADGSDGSLSRLFAGPRRWWLLGSSVAVLLGLALARLLVRGPLVR